MSKKRELSIIVESKTDEEESSTPEQENRHRVLILRAQYISLLVTIINLTFTSISASMLSTKISLAFSTSNLLNILGFVVLVWRFGTRLSAEACPCEASAKEKRALVALAVIFIVSAALILFGAVFTYVNRIVPSSGILGVLFNFIACVAYLLLAIWNYLFKRRTKKTGCVSVACIISAYSSLSALSVSLSMLIYMSNADIWYLNIIVGVFIGVFVFAFGLRLLLRIFYFKDC